MRWFIIIILDIKDLHIVSMVKGRPSLSRDVTHYIVLLKYSAIVAMSFKHKPLPRDNSHKIFYTVSLSSKDNAFNQRVPPLPSTRVQMLSTHFTFTGIRIDNSRFAGWRTHRFAQVTLQIAILEISSFTIFLFFFFTLRKDFYLFKLIVNHSCLDELFCRKN